MSNDVRGVFHDAAKVPSGEPDVAGAWRRGRRMRVQRRALSGIAIVAVIALGAVGIVNILPSDNGATPLVPATTNSATCAAPSTKNDLPAWTESANPPAGVPHLVSPDGNVVAVEFGNPLRASSAGDTHNKILWIVREPRDGQPLKITATLPGSTASPVRLTVYASSSPGGIYPSYVDVPQSGCWRLALAWNGHRSTINLLYGDVVAPVPATTSTSIPSENTTTPSTAAATVPTTCRTVNLAITVSGPVGSAGHFNYELVFRNHGASACVMTGFPGVSFLDSAGHQIGTPAQRNSLSYVPVTVAPGASAYAHLSITDPSVLSGCPATPVAKIRIFPPNETADARIDAGGITVCASQPGSTIDPVLNHSLG